MNQERKRSRKEQGEETRKVLLEVGARLFGTTGFHGVSMRQLVSEAGVNLSTVNYHFGSKAGLYRAIIETIIAVQPELFPAEDTVLARLEDAGDDPVKQAGCVKWYVGRMVRGLIGNPAHVWPAFIISRELAQPSEEFAFLLDEFFNPSFHSLRALVSGVLPKDTEPEEVVITVHGIIGMLVKFLEGRDLITQRLGWDGYGPAEVEKLASVLSKRAAGYLGLPMENE